MRISNSIHWIGTGIVWLVLMTACSENDREVVKPVTMNAEQYDAQVVTDWFDLVSTLTRETPGYTPPVAARAFGYTGVALYEAVAPGSPAHQSLSGQLNDFVLTARPEPDLSYHWPSSANAALSTMVETFYATASPERLQAIADLNRQFSEQFASEASPEVIARSVAFGEQVARQVLAWSESDGGYNGDRHNFPEYTPPVGEAYWVPTAPGYSPALQPGAMAIVLTDLFGENYAFVDSTHVKREDIEGAPRSFSSFVDLAEEAAISRMYGGIHYREAVERGLTQGYAIGKNVNQLNVKIR